MSDSRAQRLVDEFLEGAASTGGHSVRHGIAAVLRHVIDTEADEESFYAIPQDRLEHLATALTAHTLLDRALAGDSFAARQFLREAGFTDGHGVLLPWFRSEGETSR
jgi:hypothetical protein